MRSESNDGATADIRLRVRTRWGSSLLLANYSYFRPMACFETSTGDIRLGSPRPCRCDDGSVSRRSAISAIYRWMQRGIKGVRLDAIRIGGTTYTSREALQRFALPAVAPHAEAENQLSKTRQKQIDEAIQRLDEFLCPRKSRGVSGKPFNQCCQPLNRRDDLPA